MNNETVFSEIVKLIEDKMGKYKKTLLRETRLERDLGMTGDDAFEFLEEFSKKFNVDLTDFDFKKYFASEGDGLFNGLLGMFLKKEKDRVFTDLTIGDLEDSVRKGKLI